LDCAGLTTNNTNEIATTCEEHAGLAMTNNNDPQIGYAEQMDADDFEEIDQRMRQRNNE